LLICNVSLLRPSAAGVKMREIVQVAPVGSVAGLIGQVLVCVKSVRPFVMPVSVMALVEVFVRVICLAALATPSTWLPKGTEAGDTDSGPPMLKTAAVKNTQA
jgi:hypothetical protein